MSYVCMYVRLYVCMYIRMYVCIHIHIFIYIYIYIISYPPCKKGIRPGICVKPAVSHEAGGRVRYGWLNADTRPYPFFTRGITNLSSVSSLN